MQDHPSDSTDFDATVRYGFALLSEAAREFQEHLTKASTVVPATPCCTPDDARQWLAGLIDAGEPDEIIRAAARHVVEVENAIKS